VVSSATGWRVLVLGVLGLGLAGGWAGAQDRLKKMPGYAQHEKMAKEIGKAAKLGALSVTWKDDGKGLEYTRDGKKFALDVATLEEKPVAEAKEDGEGKKGRGGRPGGGGRGPERGRQFDRTLSPDGKTLALYKDRNVWLAGPKGEEPKQATFSGSESARIKCGTASWVYGEELEQKTAMWWSPDSKKLAYYRFDESKVKDFYLALDQTKLQDRLDVEAYPKPGADNPVVELVVLDVAKGKRTFVDVRDGKPFTNDAVGHYVWRVAWSADGKELLFHRTNRLQNILEVVAGDPETGKTRVVLREEWPASWVENNPEQRFLKDGKRFVWASQRTGFNNYYLHSLNGGEPVTLTRHTSEVAGIVAVDEAGGALYYLARTGANPLKLQLHRVKLDGTGDTRLTDPSWHHQVSLAPDFRHFVDIAQTHDQAPITRLVETGGGVKKELASSDLTGFDKLGLKKVELFEYLAGDGKTTLYGLLHRPSNFDPAKKYPLLVSVYAGPETDGARESFVQPSALAEYGFLVASLDSRSAKGRGKRVLDSIYQNLGITEIDDQAAGVKELAKRPYVDGGRVGIFGASYGGFASAMCLARHPDVFHAAAASSSVTDFRNYDTIYTERYLGIPTDESGKKAYEKTNIMALAPKVQGRLMIFFGTADNNVHPNNSMQLIQALQKAGKSFEVQVGPDVGHAGLNQARMMEFFIENLVVGKP